MAPCAPRRTESVMGPSQSDTVTGPWSVMSETLFIFPVPTPSISDSYSSPRNRAEYELFPTDGAPVNTMRTSESAIAMSTFHVKALSRDVCPH